MTTYFRQCYATELSLMRHAEDRIREIVGGIRRDNPDWTEGDVQLEVHRRCKKDSDLQDMGVTHLLNVVYYGSKA